MIDDETRRKVARRLRVLAETPDEIGITEHAVVSTLGISAGIYDDSCRSEDVLIVADLIDRPACHDATDNFYEFVCPECGRYTKCKSGFCRQCSKKVMNYAN